MLYLIALIQSASAPVIPPRQPVPPVIVTSVPTRAPVHHDADPLPPSVFEVTVGGGGAMLWSGVLRVAQHQSARVSHTVQQAPEIACGTGSRHFGSGGTGFSLALTERSVPGGDGSLNVIVDWTREEGGSCATLAMRKVQVTATIAIARGEQMTLNGDAGLVVTIRRR